MVRPVGAGLERVQRKPQVVDRARERGEVEDEVERLVDRDVLDHVVVHEDERVVSQVLDVRERSGLEVVEADDAMPALEERLAQMRAEEACAAGDEGGWHRSRCYPRRVADASVQIRRSARTSSRTSV